MRLKQRAMFWLLGILWGSSFFWIKIGLRGASPFMLVALRLAVGIIGLAIFVLLRRPAFPRDRSTWFKLALLGTFNTAVPFVMITWGQQSIDSAVASILNSTVPLFTILIAHVYLDDERITIPKLFGLLVGFAGMILLLGRDIDFGEINSAFLGRVLVLLAAVSYAGSAVFARRNLREVSPLVQALVPLVAADALVWLVMPLAEKPIRFPVDGETWFAIGWLGLLGTFIAYILYFSLLQSIGSTKTTLVTYVVPVVGLVLGVIFLGESVDLRLALGAVLIIAGIAVVNWEPQRMRRREVSDQNNFLT